MVADAPGFSLLAVTPPSGPVSADVVDRWFQAGADPTDIAVLFREPGRALVDLLAPDGRLGELRRACDRRGLRVLAACDRRDLPEAVWAVEELGISGIQLRGDPTPATLRVVRAGMDDALVGRSVHGPPSPGDEHVDYTCVAPIFVPRTDPGSKVPIGLDVLAAWCRRPDARIFALGGVTAKTAGACIEAGARGLAGISSFFGEPGAVTEDVAALVAAVAARPVPTDRVPPPKRRRR